MIIQTSVKAQRPVMALCFPEHFLGIFSKQSEAFAPLLSSAREKLNAHPVPAVVKNHYEYAVLEHPQPSFMLFPLMFLELASRTGGIREQHREFLPWVMLAMELVAVLDDTVDETPFRSGRPTYPQRFGPRSSAPFSCFLLNTLLTQTTQVAPRLRSMTSDLIETLCALQIWEYQERYPATDPLTCSRWLQRHYDAVTPAIAYGLSSALMLNDLPALPEEVCLRFGEIMQDVDDLVNIVEHREQCGENSDLKMGIVTFPLLHVLETVPEIREALEAFWRPCRGRKPAHAGQNEERFLAQDVSVEFGHVWRALNGSGITATLQRIEHNAAACVSAAPSGLKEIIHDFVGTFVARARRATAAPELRH